MRGETNVIHEDVRESVAGSSDLSGSDPFAYAGFMRLSHGRGVSMQIDCIDSEGLCRRLRSKFKRDSLSFSAEESAERAILRSYLRVMLSCSG